MNNRQLPDHLSYSQISTYLTCPLRYQFHYVERIPPAFTSAALAFGSSIHEAVAAFYQEHLLGDRLRVDQIVDIYRQTWSGREGENIRFFNGDDEASLLEKAKQMMTVFSDQFVPTVQVVGVEEFFEIELGDMPPLTGYLDLIEQDHDGKVSIVDLKTSARKPSTGQVSQNLQLTAYNVGIEALGFDPEDIHLRLDVLTKTKTPQLVRCQTSRTRQERQRFVKLAQHVWNAIEQDVWFPKQDWQCSQCAWAEPCANW
jgi:putative RecB family exonuclease